MSASAGVMSTGSQRNAPLTFLALIEPLYGAPTLTTCST